MRWGQCEMLHNDWNLMSEANECIGYVRRLGAMRFLVRVRGDPRDLFSDAGEYTSLSVAKLHAEAVLSLEGWA